MRTPRALATLEDRMRTRSRHAMRIRMTHRIGHAEADRLVTDDHPGPRAPH